MTARRAARGFTLIELAVVIAIAGLLLGAVLVPLRTQIELSRVRDTEKQLTDIKDALYGYAVANGGRLPCPDTDSPPDGIENLGAPPALCAFVEGILPYATLGTGRQDAWGRPFRYAGDRAYVDQSGVDAPPDTDGLSVQNRAGAVLTAGTPNAPAAIVFSCGPNGMPDLENDDDGVANVVADCRNPKDNNLGSPPNPQPAAHGAAPNLYGRYMQDIPTAGTFDDVLVWVSKYTLLDRLVAAQVWP